MNIQFRWFGFHISRISKGPNVYMITMRVGRQRKLEIVYK